MFSELQRKNIESFFVDLLIISAGYFIGNIQVSVPVFLLMVISASVILLVSKKPPKKLLPVFIYVISIFFILFGIMQISNFMSLETSVLSIEHDLFTKKTTYNWDFSQITPLSWGILVFTFSLLMVYLITLSKKRTNEFLLTWLVPLLFTLLILSVTYIVGRFSGGGALIVLVYLPLRFLMAYKAPVKWYQFILLIAALIFSVKNFDNANFNYPETIVQRSFSLDADLASKYYEDFEEDKVVKLTVKDLPYAMLFNNDLYEGDYFIVVTDIWNGIWKIDKQRTIEYYKQKESYFKDSAALEQLFNTSRDGGNNLEKFYSASEKADFYEFRSKSVYFCDTIERYLKDEKYFDALKVTDNGLRYDSMYNKFYYYRALIFSETGGNTDSICYNIDKAILYDNIDALALFRKFCN